MTIETTPHLISVEAAAPKLKQVTAGVLEVAYLESGPSDGPVVILLHGFPYDVHAYAAVVEELTRAGRRCIVPFLRGFGPTRFLSSDTPRSGQQAALGADLLALMDALEIPDAVLGGYDWGGRAACIVAALWPERVRGLVSCNTGYNIQNIPASHLPIDPYRESQSWYVYYFNTERGRAGLTVNGAALCRLLWRMWSPSWSFTEDEFARSSAAQANPDFIDVVIHSYRHRLAAAPGDPALEDIERRLAAQPPITVPSIVLHGDDNALDPPVESDPSASKFTGPYQRRRLKGVGHNPPQEAPAAFADAILSLI